MQKLTNEKARELLKELQYAKVAMGGQLSIKDEYFKQALERVLGDVPEGWKLVPVEPTHTMVSQMHTWGEVTCTDCGTDVVYDCRTNIDYSWSDMLDSAPEAP